MGKQKTIAIIGAGGNAREVAEIAKELGYQVLGFLADSQGKYDSPTLGDFSWLKSNPVDCLAMGIGSPAAKLSVGTRLSSEFPEIEWPVLVAPSAYCGSGCTFERGAIICVRAVVSINVSVGQFSQINTGCMIGHEAKIGAGCLINPGSNVSGGVLIGDGVLVGADAQILQYKKVGDGATIGIGSVVLADVAPKATVFGIPARPISIPTGG